MGKEISSMAGLVVGTVTVDNVANIVNAAIDGGKLNIYTRADADKQFATQNALNTYIGLAESKYETKENVVNTLKDYLKTNDVNALNSMLNNASIISTTWYESIKNAILDITDGRYAEAATESALSSYLTKTDASNTYLTQSKATSDYLTKTDASSTYLTQSKATSDYLTKTEASNTYLTQSNASSNYLKTSTADSTYLSKTEADSTYLSKTEADSTYVKQSDYDALLDKYDTLQKEYEDLLDLYLSKTEANSTYVKQSDYNDLLDKYNTLQNEYEYLEEIYDGLADRISALESN
jgi:uncharacterized protein YjbI with pentapeptide repeats